MQNVHNSMVLAHENLRKKLWCDTWVSIGGSIGCNSKSVPTVWADFALKDFDERFPKPEPLKY
jgi:hypothetical protein